MSPRRLKQSLRNSECSTRLVTILKRIQVAANARLRFVCDIRTSSCARVIAMSRRRRLPRKTNDKFQPQIYTDRRLRGLVFLFVKISVHLWLKFPSPTPLARIEILPQSITNKIERQDGQRNRQPGEDERVRRGLQSRKIARLFDHYSP